MFKLRLLYIFGIEISSNEYIKRKQKVKGSRGIITLHEQRNKIHCQLRFNYPHPAINHLSELKSGLQHLPNPEA